jgi:hypothetical protein
LVGLARRVGSPRQRQAGNVNGVVVVNKRPKQIHRVHCFRVYGATIVARCPIALTSATSLEFLLSLGGKHAAYHLFGSGPESRISRTYAFGFGKMQF